MCSLGSRGWRALHGTLEQLPRRPRRAAVTLAHSEGPLQGPPRCFALGSLHPSTAHPAPDPALSSQRYRRAAPIPVVPRAAAPYGPHRLCAAAAQRAPRPRASAPGCAAPRPAKSGRGPRPHGSRPASPEATGPDTGGARLRAHRCRSFRTRAREAPARPGRRSPAANAAPRLTTSARPHGSCATSSHRQRFFGIAAGTPALSAAPPSASTRRPEQELVVQNGARPFSSRTTPAARSSRAPLRLQSARAKRCAFQRPNAAIGWRPTQPNPTPRAYGGRGAAPTGAREGQTSPRAKGSGSRRAPPHADPRRGSRGRPGRSAAAVLSAALTVSGERSSA